MSDYETMGNIEIKNKALEPRILKLIRENNVSMKTIQFADSPLKQLYLNTYKYLNTFQEKKPDM